MSEDMIILGMGNLLMSDDGIGSHAAQALTPRPPPGVCVADVGTDFLSALSFLESADASWSSMPSEPEERLARSIN